MFKVICETSQTFLTTKINIVEELNLQLSNVKSVSRPSVSIHNSKTVVCVTVEFNKTVDKILKEDNLNIYDVNSASELLIHH
jgi:hypothetical protein